MKEKILQEFKTALPFCMNAKIIKKLNDDGTWLRFKVLSLRREQIAQLLKMVIKIGVLESLVANGDMQILGEIKLDD